ncbi:MAG: hypothetical protein KAR42_09320 [candidate division Zixibacteria bacterium]|nr:hypothetical protein [candidate division Zixibacteria bacterium]
MTFKRQSRFALIIVIMMMALVVTAAPTKAQTPELYLALNDTTVAAGDTTAWISVKFANYQDTLAAFTMRIILDNPDLIDFRTDATDTTFDTIWQYCDTWEDDTCSNWVDTLYVDTIVRSGAIDTVGTLISGWEYVTAQSYSPNRTDIKITAFADLLGGNYTPGLNPNTNTEVLFRLRYRADAETLDTSDNSVAMLISPSLSETGFSDPHGNLIGVTTVYNFCDTIQLDPLICDTSFIYWICQDTAAGGECIDWLTTINSDSAQYSDSISIDTTAQTTINENTTFFTDGIVTVDFIGCLCGDSNSDGLFNVGDAVFLVNYIFRGGPAPVPLSCSDSNGDGEVNIGDAVWKINAIFKGGPMPIC